MLFHVLEENANRRLGLNSDLSGPQFQELAAQLQGVDTFFEALRIIGGIIPDNLSQLAQPFLDSWPSTVQAAGVHALRHAFSSEPRLPVTIAWRPHYEFGLEVIHAEGSSHTAPRVTLFLQSRYATDDRPRLDTGSMS